MKFVHLRVHSDGSLLDSTFTPERLVREAQKLKMETLALTDRDSLLRAVDFFRAASAYGFGPFSGWNFPISGKSPHRALTKSCFLWRTSRGMET